MEMKLSIIITALNDLSELLETVKSIRATAGDAPEIVVVDDCGDAPFQIPGEKVIRNSVRVGVGPSRTIGVFHATGEYVMLCDSHLRFLPGWYEAVVERLKSRPKTVMCFTCLGLDSSAMDPEHPKSKYYGATFNIFGKDPNIINKVQIMEPNWLKTVPDDDAEVPCLMGGAYACSREWFLYLSPLRFLRYWGEDETNLSLRSWYFGGDVRIMTSVGVAHKFLRVGEQQPWKAPVGCVMYNKLFTFHTLLPDNLRLFLMEKINLYQGGGEYAHARKMLDENPQMLEVEKVIVKTRSVRGFDWVVQKFGLQMP